MIGNNDLQAVMGMRRGGVLYIGLPFLSWRGRIAGLLSRERGINRWRHGGLYYLGSIVISAYC